ncbi:MAG: hypothetical protein ACI89L_002479 [Phycisphaerales bacterium]|jgi:hypothetical protein
MATPRIDSQTLSALMSRNTTNDLATRLGQAARLRQGGLTPSSPGSTPATNGKGISRPTDQVVFDSLDQQFGETWTMFDRMTRVVSQNGGLSREEYNAAIQQALKPFTVNPNGKAPGGVSTDFNPELVLTAAINGKGLEPGEEVEIVATLEQSAQQAGLYLELGANAYGSSGEINLGGGGGTFTIDVMGTEGSRELSFSSNQTLGQMAAAINSFTGETGVEAMVSGTGIRLTSSGSGSGDFTSVRIVDDAGIVDNGSGNTLGIYELAEDDFSVATGTATTFSSSRGSNGVWDEGRDAVVGINGVQAQLVGGYWFANLGGSLEVALQLDLGALGSANGPVSLGTVGKAEHGHGNGLRAGGDESAGRGLAEPQRRLDLEG